VSDAIECLMWLIESSDDITTELPDDYVTGEPRDFKAYRRMRAHFQAWRDRHDADADPMRDEGLAQFCVADVAILCAECMRLQHVERRIMDVLSRRGRRI
jgi:hypothetical protein